MKYKNFTIINFSRELHDRLINWGYDSKYIQYFPVVRDIQDWGNNKAIFFWQRISKINNGLMQEVCSNIVIDTIHIHKAWDPGHTFEQNEFGNGKKIEYSEWFNTREEMQSCIQNAAYYFAPRISEGIGLSFLEAMAMGRCVIANDDSTMNEYIKNGETGFLYDFRNPVPISCDDVRKIQKNTYEYMKIGRDKWEKECYKIINWIREEKSIKEVNQIIEGEESRFKSYFGLFDKWLELKTHNKHIESYFKRNRYNRILVYGGGKVAKRFIEDMEHSFVEIVGIIDREKIQGYKDIPVYGLESDLPKADAIVVTPVWAYFQVQHKLMKLNVPILPLTTIVEEELNEGL